MSNNQGLLMVIVSGKDRPGITARFSRIIMEHQVEVMDIEQASLQNLLGIYFILDLSEARDSEDSVMKGLLFEASRLGVTLNFRLYGPGEIAALNQRSLYVLTYFGGTPPSFRSFSRNRTSTLKPFFRQPIMGPVPWK